MKIIFLRDMFTRVIKVYESFMQQIQRRQKVSLEKVTER